MQHKIALQREVLRLVLIISATVAIGTSFGQPLWGALAGLIACQIITFYRLNALFQWSNDKGKMPKDNGLLGYSVDSLYSKERKLNKLINKQKKQLRRISEGLESLNDGVLIVDSEGYINAYNLASCHLLGLKKETDKGQHILNLIRAPIFTKFFEKGKYNKTIELESPYRSNLIVQIQIAKFGIAQKIIIVRDVTEGLRVEKMKQHFIADVSHELRTPLTVIAGYLEMLSDMEINPGIDRAVKQMNGQSERMQSLVNDLLHLSKLESNNTDTGKEWFDLKSICNLCVDQLRSYTPTSLQGDKFPEAEITCDCIDNVEVLGFAEEVSSIFTNLLTNSIKYGRKEGDTAHIHIAIKNINRGVEVSFLDHGEGIAEDHLSHLTERFYRVDESRESTIGGSGLGLAIVRHALEHHDAQLKIESTVGKGSCFSFVLPNERIRYKK